MRERIFRIKRNWNRSTIYATLVDDQKPDEQVIRTGFDQEKVYIDTPIPDFKERLVNIAMQVIAKNDDRIKALRYTFKKKSMDDLVRRIVDDTVRQAFDEMTAEMKDFTKFVV